MARGAGHQAAPGWGDGDEMPSWHSIRTPPKKRELRDASFLWGYGPLKPLLRGAFHENKGEDTPSVGVSEPLSRTERGGARPDRARPSNSGARKGPESGASADRGLEGEAPGAAIRTDHDVVIAGLHGLDPDLLVRGARVSAVIVFGGGWLRTLTDIDIEGRSRPRSVCPGIPPRSFPRQTGCRRRHPPSSRR